MLGRRQLLLKMRNPALLLGDLVLEQRERRRTQILLGAAGAGLEHLVDPLASRDRAIPLSSIMTYGPPVKMFEKRSVQFGSRYAAAARPERGPRR